MWIPRSVGLLGMATVLLAGCSGHRAPRGAPFADRCATVFRIDNEGPERVDVFLHSGMLVRLGAVSAWRSARFRALGGTSAGTGIRLIARPVAGGGSVSTDRLWLASGDDVRWTITQPLEYSAITAVIEHAGADGGAEACTGGRTR